MFYALLVILVFMHCAAHYLTIRFDPIFLLPLIWFLSNWKRFCFSFNLGTCETIVGTVAQESLLFFYSCGEWRGHENGTQTEQVAKSMNKREKMHERNRANELLAIIITLYDYWAVSHRLFPAFLAHTCPLHGVVCMFFHVTCVNLMCVNS